MAISTAIDASARARVLGIQTLFRQRKAGSILFLPQTVAIIGQGATASTYSNVKAQFTNAFDVGSTYGFGSPVHLAARELLPENGDGIGTIPMTVYALDDDGSGVVSDGDITPTVVPTEAASYVVRINNIDSATFVIAVGDVVADVVTAMTAAINAELNVPIIAVDATTSVTFTSKWKGVSANDIYIEVIGPTDVGNSFAITQANGGLVNPDVDSALTQVGDVWETLFVSCMESTDVTTLGLFDTFGEGRWGALVRKPMIAFTGSGEATLATAIAVPDARTTDRTNCQIAAPGSNNLPLVIAARAVARIAVLANNNPPYDYGRQELSGLVPGTDGEQWTYADRDVAVKAGTSTTEVKDSVINLSDTVTYYHPAGQQDPAYRYVVDIVKLQNIIFNIDLIFNTAEWDGAPLIPDDQPTINPAAKKPKTARAATAAMIDSLGLNAIISDPESAKANTLAEIDSGNPKRLNLVIPVDVSGNTNIISTDLEFSFFFS